ncbi:MAG: exo-alpha-sialidase, partial [Solirubrobacteraceae bacterium]|nr:exo-alpha-sialidase [Solirubrobacteraceae bacterium]
MRGIIGGIVLALAVSGPAEGAVKQPPGLGVKAFTLTADPNARKPNVAVDDMGVGHFLWDVNNNGGDDPAVYCRVPRGATACASTQTFNLPLEAFGEPQVLTPAPGEVILVAHRCCGKGEGTYAIVSTDGGATFAAPAVIGTIEPGQAVYGPGTGVVSLTDDIVTAGVSYQAAPLDGPVPAGAANVGDGPNLQSYDGTIGFPSANVPIVAFDDLTNGFWREWGGTGDPNDLATWKP